MHKPVAMQLLNPADHFTLAIDQQIRDQNMPGSLCAFALELEQSPDIDALRKRTEEFTRRFPLALASLQQRGRRFYWCSREHPQEFFFQHSCPAQQPQNAFIHARIAAIINQRQARETISPLEFHLISTQTKHIFVMRWIHPLCDARGADLILKYLCTDDAESRNRFDKPETGSLVDSYLNKFSVWKKLNLFFKARRYILQLDQLHSIVPLMRPQSPQRLNYAIHRLSEKQTVEVIELSRRHVGLTGTSLYYIGCLMRALEKIAPNTPGDAYCVPYAFNLRKQKALTPLFGNHVCALFAQAPRHIVQDRKQLFTYLKQQNSDVIRQQLDYAFLPLMWAGSWLSLQRYGETIRQSYKSGSERASFWFSDIGSPDLSGSNFFGAKINGLFHLCQISSPPSLALLSCRYQNRLTFTYNFSEPLVDQNWLDQLHTLMLAELLDAT